ncbi:MAG: NADH-quinone oxidoreductase subunit H, partial [Komagataeibacter saccharivorans]
MTPLPLAPIVLTPLVVLALATVLTWVERRLLGLWQDRYGPNRVGPGGMFQAVADGIKLLFKQDWVPPFADRGVFVLAPAIGMMTM